MQIINYSVEPLNKLFFWLPRGLKSEEVICFPDACHGKPALPNGTIVFMKQDDWRNLPYPIAASA